MRIWELMLVAVGLSMDAFAVSVCKGMAAGKPEGKHYLTVGAWFGGFQALMPTLGFLLGSTFEQYITAVDHWIAFILLGLIGAGMIHDGCSRTEQPADASFRFRPMLLMAVATSIDALAVGITFALLPEVNVPAAVLLIGLTTFVLSAAGLKIGSVFGLRWRSGAQIAGGVILILIGLKILLEHLGILP